MEHLGSPYFLFLAIGFGFGFLYLVRVGEARGLPRLGLIDVCIAAILGGLIGGRILHVVAEPLPGHDLQPHQIQELADKAPTLDPELQAKLQTALATPPVPAAWLFLVEMPAGEARSEAFVHLAKDKNSVPVWLWYRTHPSHIPQFWRGGLAYFGGLILAVILCLVATVRHKMPVREAADITAPAIILGLAFGRIGCFLGGCCYGAECDPAWWSDQPSWYPAPVGGTHRYPTAIASAVFAFALFLALREIHKRRAFPGEVFLAMIVLYAPGRFVIEALRADPRGGAGGLSTTQLLVLISGAPALALWVVLRLRAPAPTPEPKPKESPSDDFKLPPPADLGAPPEPSADPQSEAPPPAKDVESPPCPNE
ncbi:MAG: prolipoprotein diacylglyceryl transferase [Planctomycetes bacterium]|nr:prolipoprotein diacylglyceryl transferase [Planctomycetota bacterium]